jgi:ComF family protein
MADRLAARSEIVSGAAVVTSVPLHPDRRRERGWDQAALIARAAAVRWSLPWRDGMILRVRSTGAQSGLDRDARARNVAGAFAAPSPVDGVTVILVDDVLTTGATAGAAAAALVAAGAREVRVAAVARD